MTKKKAPAEDAWDDEPVEAEVEPEAEEAAEPELTTVEATDEGVYKTGQDCTIKNQFYAAGATVVLTPEELESVQAIGIKILPAA
jgi:hypothetical protein